MLITLAVLRSAKVDWGDVPTWTGGGITFLALLAATAAAIQARNLLRVEQDRDRQSRLERSEQIENGRRRQAEAICAWVEIVESGPTRADTILVVAVRNASDLPAYDLALRLKSGLDNATHDWAMDFPVLPPNAEPRKIPVLGLNGFESNSEGSGLKPELEFLDAGGRRWCRTIDGSLVSVSPE